MTTLSFNSVPADKFTNKGGDHPEVDRINKLISKLFSYFFGKIYLSFFAETIENYGVKKKFIFTLKDLHEKYNIPKVVRCLEEIETLVISLMKSIF